jgi:hypothetical protein
MIDLSNYLIAELRDGSNPYKKDQAIENMDINTILVVYRDDVYTYYYSVPLKLKNKVGFALLEFFYQDNHDYSDEKLQDFKDEYSEFFGV